MNIDATLAALIEALNRSSAATESLVKSMQPNAGAESSDEPAKTAPKKRGRPKKTESSDEPEKAAPKKRGRPKKKTVSKTMLIKIAADWLKDAQGDADLIASRRDTIKKIVAEWESERISELPKEAWEPVFSAIQAAIAAESAEGGADDEVDEDDIL